MPRCNQCWKEFPTLNRHHHSNTDYYFCDGCLKANLWDCPECDRSFYIGLNQGRYPRHYRMTDKVDYRFRQVREVCPGWKSDKRLAAEKYYGWSMEVPSAKTQKRVM